MSLREIPRSFEFICDGCGAKEAQASNTRPKGSSNLHIGRDAYDYQGMAVADASCKRLLCFDCSAKLEAAINAAFPKAHVPS